jgi:hypothetical protein
MKIIKNTTNFDTRFMRSLIVGVHNHIAKHEGRYRRWKHLEVQIWNRSNSRSGHAYLGGTFMHLSVSPNLPTAGFVWLAYHEMMHVYGYRHGEFYDLTTEDCATLIEANGWPAAMPTKEAKPKKAADHVGRRYANAVARLAEWKAKERRAKKRRQAWAAKVKAYEKRYEGTDRLAASRAK